ncbi:hypothetical protein MRX96_053331 [Rhipicephalus microplus]
MAYDTDSLRRLVGSGSRGSSGGARSATPGSGKNVTGARRLPPLLHFGSRLPRANVSACFLFLCLVGAVSSLENGTSPSVVPNLCNLAQEEPMYCRCSSEHFEADTTGVVCYVGKPLTGKPRRVPGAAAPGSNTSRTWLSRSWGALRELELGDNFIHVVTNRTFKGLAQLTRLDLYRNKLMRLDAGIFVSTPLLEELDLKLNQISVIDPLAFDGLARLRLIYLANNQLRILPADMFVGAPNLNLVDLEQNQLVTLTWRTIHNLKYLKDGDDFTMSLTGE